MDFRPLAWTPPPNPGLRAGPYAANRELARAELWPVGGSGPEDVAVDAAGRVYTGLEDGRILRFEPDGGAPEVIADTGGRPLGIEVAPDGALVICDAALGLLRLDPTGGLDILADGYQGEPFGFTNNASVAADGTVYFTDTSRRWPIERYKLDLLEHTGTGRLFARGPDGELALLLDGLQFANGVALAPDESHLLVAETGAYRIRRYWLAGRREGDDVWVDNLPGFPDNLSWGDGVVWVPMPSPRNALLDATLPRPWARHLIARLPEALQPRPERHGLLLGFDPDGNLVHNLQDETGRVAILTGARQHGSRIYLGSLSEPSIAVYEL